MKDSKDGFELLVAADEPEIEAAARMLRAVRSMRYWPMRVATWADVAVTGYKAMMDGDAAVVAGVKNKLQAAMAHVRPDGVLAEMHRGMSEPGTASKA